MGQTSSRPPNNDYTPFLVQVWLWGGLWNISVQSLIIASCYTQSIFYNKSQANKNGSLCRIREDRRTVQNDFLLLLFGQLMRHPLIRFSPFQFVSNATKFMIHSELIDKFSCGFKRTHLNNYSQLVIVISGGQSLLPILRALVSFANS